eukprot:7633250-Pyramimonas_sp.AAC.1
MDVRGRGRVVYRCAGGRACGGSMRVLVNGYRCDGTSVWVCGWVCAGVPVCAVWAPISGTVCRCKDLGQRVHKCGVVGVRDACACGRRECGCGVLCSMRAQAAGPLGKSHVRRTQMDMWILCGRGADVCGAASACRVSARCPRG